MPHEIQHDPKVDKKTAVDACRRIMKTAGLKPADLEYVKCCTCGLILDGFEIASVTIHGLAEIDQCMTCHVIQCEPMENECSGCKVNP